MATDNEVGSVDIIRPGSRGCWGPVVRESSGDAGLFGFPRDPCGNGGSRWVIANFSLHLDLAVARLWNRLV